MRAGDNGGQVLDLCDLKCPPATNGALRQTQRTPKRWGVFSTDANISGELGVSQMCTAYLLLLTSGCQNAPEPTPARPPARPPARVPLRCGLYSPIGASVRQAYYSYPEGALSLLTGRHKYSSTSSVRVNGCPSAASRTDVPRACCRRALWAILSQRQGRLRGGTNGESYPCSQRKQIRVLECDPKTLLSSMIFLK